jgi:hypothetical protein
MVVVKVWLCVYVRDEEERRETEKAVMPTRDWRRVCSEKHTHTALNRAENIFGLPQTLLLKYVKMKINILGEAVQIKSGRKPIFSAETEKGLVEYLLFVNEAIRSDNSRCKKTCLPFTFKKWS